MCALPVVEDLEEALQVHAHLVGFIEASDARYAQSTTLSSLEQLLLNIEKERGARGSSPSVQEGLA